MTRLNILVKEKLKIRILLLLHSADGPIAVKIFLYEFIKNAPEQKTAIDFCEASQYFVNNGPFEIFASFDDALPVLLYVAGYAANEIKLVL